MLIKTIRAKFIRSSTQTRSHIILRWVKSEPGSLPVQKFSSSNCHWSMGRVHQVVDVLTVLIRQGIFAASAKDRHNRSHLNAVRWNGPENQEAKCWCGTAFMFGTFGVTHCRMRVTSLMASTATSYSLSSVIDTMRSWKIEQDRREFWTQILDFIQADPLFFLTLKRLVKSSSLGNSSRFV